MSATHTPGPWHRNIKPASKYPVVWAGRNTHVAAISPGVRSRTAAGTISEEEMEANINLIAAAPDLLLAAKEAAIVVSEFAKAFGADPTKGTCLQRLMAAVAKAEGRT